MSRRKNVLGVGVGVGVRGHRGIVAFAPLAHENTNACPWYSKVPVNAGTPTAIA